MASVCIVCQKDVTGKRAAAVKEDQVIRTIRTVKRFFRIAQNNELYVCEDDMPAHLKKRADFEKSLVFFGVLAALVVILLVVTLIISGSLEPIGFVSAIVIGVFILLFAVVFKYAPEIEKTPSVVSEGGRKAPLPAELEELEEKEAGEQETGSRKQETGKPARSRKKR